MKKLFCSFLSVMSIIVCYAQPTFEYCDVYARGSWNNLAITIMYKQQVQSMRGNIGNVLNKMAEDGWVLDESIVIPRHGVPFTRHKLHFIMKREVLNNNITKGATSVSKHTEKKVAKSKDNPVVTISDPNISTRSGLLEEFVSGELALVDKNIQAIKMENLHNEILSDIDGAATQQGITIANTKIQVLEAFNRGLARKNYSIVDKVNESKLLLKKKAKKLGLAVYM